MYVLFEEDGAFKTGTVLTQSDASLQVETASGKRSKIKAANVLLRYSDVAPAELIARAEAVCADMDVTFLWECASEGEFAFGEFADEYFGHRANSIEATAILMTLFASPVYFHRKGKGRFRKAPEDILAAALAGLEKKRLQAEAIERMSSELQQGILPAEFNPALVLQLLYKPDRNRSECKALEAACAASGKTSVEILHACGAVKSPYDYHYNRFLFESFPQGTGFSVNDLPSWPESLNTAPVKAFSIDDVSTTEIDDAFSVAPLMENGEETGWRVGVHIAAPGLSVLPDSPLAKLARERLSTVYMPGHKITMLPEEVIHECTLAAGRVCPVVSLYLSINQNYELIAHESCIEQVEIAANLRLSELEPFFNEQTVSLAAPVAEVPFWDELKVLWHIAGAFEKNRGKPAAKQGINDYNFVIEGDLASPDTCQVRIDERKRGNPLDKLVSELMIMANSTWGGWLAEKGIAAIYRVQTNGKVRQTTSPLPHEGLGVAQYAWISSPLRRYVDLINQWQLIAALEDKAPVFGNKSDDLFASMREFELTYASYSEFQRQMERYWCLRWLRQENKAQIEATVIKENLCKLDHLPVLQRVASLPDLPRGQKVLLTVENIDFFTLGLSCLYLETLNQAKEVESELELDEEPVEAAD